MQLLRFNLPGFERALSRALTRSSLFDAEIEKRVREVIANVQSGGDKALVELTERFDRVKLRGGPSALPVTEPTPRVTPAIRKAIEIAHRNIAKFSKKSLSLNWQMRNAQGGRVGEKFDPFQRVGIYVPGGTAPLVSTALMTVVLARIAGCPEIVVCTPPSQSNGYTRGGKPRVDPTLLYALRKAGATQIYRLGGAQAVAAMALGTGTIERVQKIFGPGNAYVVAAKRLLFGHVAIDLLPGPSELLVIADNSAPARYVAADLLAQAEHGSGYERVWLVTDSQKLID